MFKPTQLITVGEENNGIISSWKKESQN